MEPLQISAIKSQAEGDLLKSPGVTGVAVGYKYVGGRRTGEVGIQVFVEKKRDVPQKQMVPSLIDGVKTDVIERKFVLQTVSVKLDELRLQADTGRYDPLKGGISIGPCRAIGGYVFVGTLGAIVRDNATGDPMLLSNFHVMCVDNTWSVGDTMAQPGRVDGGACPADVVGTLQRASVGGQVDCAVAAVTARNTVCEIVDIGTVAGTANATLGMAVRKRGRTTGLTYGTVDSVALTVTVPYGDGIGDVTLTNQIGIAVDTVQSTVFGQQGDSGSVVVDGSRNVIGLHFAGSEDGTFGVANPIQAVLTALNVTMCAAPTKSLIKDLKDRKLEKVEFKERKLEKFEKVERKEFKDFRKERKESKEFKELKPEFEKVVPDKPPKEIAEIGPKEFEWQQPRQPGIRGAAGASGTIEERLGRVEAAVDELAHFIVAGLRPELGEGALSEEPDIAAMSGQLRKEAADAKQAKDNKDVEKQRDF